MEEDKWQDNITSEQNSEHNKEGYPSSQRNKDYNKVPREGRTMRPRIQRIERAYSANGTQGAQQGRPYRPNYQPRQDYRYKQEYTEHENHYNNNGNNLQRNTRYQPGNYNKQNGYREGGYNNQTYRKRQGKNGYTNNRYGNHPGQFRTPGYNPYNKYSMKKQIEYKELNLDSNAPIRLNKFLANAGVCSRREADDFISAGVVRVNGQVVTELGSKVKRTDEVIFHDQLVNIERKVYVLLNKPKDYVTTSDDPQNRKTVMDLVKDACKERIYPVGRLDRNTTGVLLLTNDGELAAKLTHPKYLKKKVYQVTTDKNVTAADIKKIADGIILEDGEIHADAIEYTSPTEKNQIGIEIHSGRNRIVRRIFESLGYHIIRLDRVLFAGLTKKGVRRGDWRFLTEQEVNMLRMGAF